MKNQTKKLLSLALAAALLLGAAPLTALKLLENSVFSPRAEAASGYFTSGYCGDVSDGRDGTDIAWTLRSGVLTLTGTGVMGSVPNQNDNRVNSLVVGEGITGLADHAFENCGNLRTVTLPSTMETIGSYAFSGDSSLLNLNLGGTQVIGGSAFYQCAGLTSLSLSDAVIQIGAEAFRYCTALTSAVLPETLETVSYCSFSDCTALKTVSMGSRIKTIEGGAFAWSAIETLTLPEGLEEIGSAAFANCAKLTALTFPSSLRTIGYQAFHDCTSLNALTLPVSLRSIGKQAFVNCTSLNALTLPVSLRSIGEQAFGNCTGLRGTVTIPDACETVGADAFKKTNISRLQIGAGVREFGRNGDMPNLTSITLSPDNTELTLYKNVLYAPECASVVLLPQNLSTLYLPQEFPLQTAADPDDAEHPCGFLGGFSSKKSISSIVAHPQSDCYASVNGVLYTKDLRSLVICPPNWQSSGALTVPAGTVRIEAHACSGVSALTSVVFPEGLEYIGAYAFYSTGLTQADIPAGVRTIGQYAFYELKLQSLTLREGLVSIGAYAFQNCFISADSSVAYTGQTALTIPGSVETVGSYAFKGCKGITRLTLGEGLREIANNAFSGCPLGGRLVIPDSCERIASDAFASATLSSLSVGAGLRDVPSLKGVFLGCASLGAIELSPENEAFDLYSGALYTSDHTKVVGLSSASTLNLPPDFPPYSVSSSSEEGEEDDFTNFLNGCSFLQAINAHPDSPWYSSIGGILYSKDGKTLIACPGGKRTAEIADGTELIAVRAFNGCESITSVVIPDGVTRIGDNAFRGCSSVTSVIIPGSVKRLGNGAFCNCKSLKTLTLSEGLEEIGDDAFNAKNVLIFRIPLQSLAIPSTVVSIGARAFRKTQIETLTLPEGLKRIGQEAFYGCSKLQKVEIPDSVEELGARAFESCSALKRVVIGSGIRVLRDREFKGCSKLYSLTLSDSFQTWERRTRNASTYFWEKDNTNYNNLTYIRVPNPYTVITDIERFSPQSGSTGTVCGYCGSPAHEIAVKRLYSWSSLGHTFLDWYTAVPATFESAGVQRRDCAYCSYYEQRVIPKLERDIYTATFVANGNIVAQIDFPRGAVSVDAPAVPARDRYTGRWEDYTLADADITINAVYTLIQSGGASEIETDSTVTHYCEKDDVLFRVSASSAAKTVKSVVSQSVPLDIVLVVDQSGSMDETLGGSVKKVDALKAAAHEFIGAVADNAALTGADHRIAIAGFGLAGNYSGYLTNENTELLTSGRGAVPFADITPADYAAALIGIDDRDALDTAVDAIEARGATAADLGLEMAKGIFANTDSTGRDRIVVFMTDGAPTYQSSFQSAVANSAVANARLLKTVCGALVYSVGVFSGADANNANVRRFMQAVSSNYPNARSYTNPGTAEADSFFTTVNDTAALSGVFHTITTESLSHTASFDNVTLIKTLSKYVTLTAPQEQALRVDAIRKYGIANDRITVIRNRDGTTVVRLDGLTPYAVEQDGAYRYEVSLEFFASLNENAAAAGVYTVDDEDSGIMLGGALGYEAVFATGDIALSAAKTRYLFTINGELYEIAEAPTVAAATPETDFAADWQFSGWNTAGVASENGVIVDATLVKAPRTVVWHTADGDVSQIYTEGQFLNPPAVADRADGSKFLSWNRSLPTVMPDEDLEFTAVYGEHVHKYISETEQPATCTENGVTRYTCLCGDTYTEAILATGHDYEAIAPSAEQDASRCTFVCNRCGDRYEYALDYQITVSTHFGRSIQYEFQLTDDNLNVGFEPDGSVAISIPLSEFQSGARGVRVTRTVNGVKEVVPTRIEDGFLIITADHFTPYEIDFLFDCMENGEHDWDEGETVLAPTCKEEGLRRFVCAVCGENKNEPIPVDPENHSDYGTMLVNASDATCCRDGYTGDTVCAGCGHVFASGEVVSQDTVPHAWDDGAVTLKPTCSTTGTVLYRCTVKSCGATKEEELKKDPDAHVYRVTVTEPTCTEGGCTTYACTLCRYGYAADETDPLGHEDANGDGRCDRCGAALSMPESNCVCGQYHTGPVAGYIRFFHSLIYFFRNLFNT